MLDYRARFQAMVDQLEKDKRFEVSKCAFGKAASQKDVEAATRAAGGELPPGVAELYAEVNGFELVWKQVDGFHKKLTGEDPMGFIAIPPIYGPAACDGVFSDWRDSLYFDDEDPKRHAKPIDNSGGELGANTLAVFYPVPGAATIHYHDTDGELHPTGYSLQEYLERLLMCRGYRSWTGALCVDLAKAPETKHFLHDAALLFEDFDAASFKPQTKARQLQL